MDVRPITLWRVLDAMQNALAITLLVQGPLFFDYLYGKFTHHGYAYGDFHDNLVKSVVDIVLFLLVMLGLDIYTNQIARLPKEIEYSRDLPAMSPACAASLAADVDPGPEGVDMKAATLLALEEKKLIAIYPGVVADYEGF